MPKHALLKYSQEGGADASAINDAWPTTGDPTDVIGTGPFRLTNYTPGQLVQLERWDNYWKVDEAGNRLPYVDSLQFLVVTGTEAQTAQFLAGNLDQLNISGGQFPDFKGREVAANRSASSRAKRCSAARPTWPSTSTLLTRSWPSCSRAATSAAPWTTPSTATASSTTPTTGWPPGPVPRPPRPSAPAPTTPPRPCTAPTPTPPP